MGGRAGREQPVDVGAASPAAARCSPGCGRLGDHVDRLARPVLARLRQAAARRLPELVDRACLADDHPRTPVRGRPAKASQPSPDGHDVRADVAERREAAVRRASTAVKRPSPRRATSSRKTRSTGFSRAEIEHLLRVGSIRGMRQVSYSQRAMPIHLRAEPGQYAEAVLLPGDPLRAKYIAETYLEDVVQRNAERGLLGYTGTYKGKPVSVQGTGMGCPGATIVFEELVQLGCKKLIRVGTCGGLQPHHALGDLIVALTAVPADSTAMHLVATSRTARPPPGRSIHGAVHVAKEIGQELHVGPIVSSDLFYNPDDGPVRALVEARRPRGRDGGRRALHRRRDPRRRGGLPADGQRHRRRGRVHADHATRSCGRPSTG